jgi:hypothetical protein
MDAVTQVALVGVVGTVLGALVGAMGAVRAAGVNTRGQSRLEDHKSRRAAYAACTTALFVRRDAIAELMEGMHSADLTVEEAREKLAQAQAMRGDVMKTVGAVVVEGPAGPADFAEAAARHLDIWLSGLAHWVGEGLPERMRDREQWHGRLEDQSLTERALERFATQCRRQLHPAEYQPVRAYLWGRWADRQLRRSGG